MKIIVSKFVNLFTCFFCFCFCFCFCFLFFFCFVFRHVTVCVNKEYNTLDNTVVLYSKKESVFMQLITAPMLTISIKARDKCVWPLQTNLRVGDISQAVSRVSWTKMPLCFNNLKVFARTHFRTCLLWSIWCKYRTYLLIKTWLSSVLRHVNV